MSTESKKIHMKATTFMETYDVSRSNFYILIHTKNFPAFKVGNLWYVDVAKYEKICERARLNK